MLGHHCYVMQRCYESGKCRDVTSPCEVVQESKDSTLVPQLSQIYGGELTATSFQHRAKGSEPDKFHTTAASILQLM